jgi:hypothetical protein
MTSAGRKKLFIIFFPSRHLKKPSPAIHVGPISIQRQKAAMRQNGLAAPASPEAINMIGGRTQQHNRRLRRTTFLPTHWMPMHLFKAVCKQAPRLHNGNADQHSVTTERYMLYVIYSSSSSSSSSPFVCYPSRKSGQRQTARETLRRIESSF